MRPLKMRCQLCRENEAERLLIDLKTGEDVLACRRCLLIRGFTGRPLPEVEEVRLTEPAL